jgi:uncharacterized membrane protein
MIGMAETMIQAANIIVAVADETMLAVDRLFPEKIGDGRVDDDEDVPALPPLPAWNWRPVPARGNGFI